MIYYLTEFIARKGKVGEYDLRSSSPLKAKGDNKKKQKKANQT